MFLAACSGDADGFEVSGQVAGGQVAYVGPALAAARQDFFGGGGTGGGGTIAGGTSAGVTGGGFGLDEPVRLQGAIPAVIAVTWSRHTALGDGWQVQSALRLSHQEARAYLPEGLAVLTDPMQVALSAEAAGAEVMLRRAGELGRGWTWDYGAGLGVQDMAIRADLQSALIDLTSLVNVTQFYALASGRLVHPSGLGLTGQVMIFDRGGTEYQVGFVQAF